MTDRAAPASVADGDIAMVDWTGRAIDADTCAACPHADLLARGACQPGRSCMQDVYARRIDRFFRNHPDRANDQLRHPYFEVRAIAARYADLFHLQSLLEDEDETVRLQLALRVSQRLLRRMLDDPHREVRIRVAQRIGPDALPGLLGDSDYQVRCIVAQRLPVPLLDGLARDTDWRVRWEVAGRAAGPALQGLLADTEADVRDRAAERACELAAKARQEEPQHG